MKLSITCTALLSLLQHATAFTVLTTPSRLVTTSHLLATATPSLLQNSTHSSDDQHSEQISNNQEMNRWADAIAFAPSAQLAVQAATYIEQQQREGNLVSFNTVLKGWARCGHRLTELRQNHMAHRVDSAGKTVNWKDLEASGIDNEFAVYTPRDAVEHASALLETNADNIPLDAQSYNIIMDAWSKLKNIPDAVEKIDKLLQKTPQPDIFAYNSLLEAHSSSSSEEGLENAIKIFSKLSVQPNSHTYNTVLHAYSKKAAGDYRQAQECALAAEKLLNEAYKSHKADVMSYTSVMECWSRVNDGANHVEAILDRFKDTVHPNIYTYNVLMQSYRRPPNIQKATALLEQLLAPVEETKRAGVRANAVACTTYLTVLGKSRTESQAVDALRLIQRMNTLSTSHPAITPSLVTYNAALEVCAQVPETKGTSQLVALKIAFALLKSLEQHERLNPNHVTYSTLLKAIAWLLPAGSQERDQVAKALFEKAKAAGQVDSFTLKNLQRASSASLYADVMAEMEGGSHFSSDSPIPMSWSRNVRL